MQKKNDEETKIEILRRYLLSFLFCFFFNFYRIIPSQYFFVRCANEEDT